MTNTDSDEHGIPEFGRLNESIQEHERRRLTAAYERQQAIGTPLTPTERVQRDRLNRELQERDEGVEDRHDVIAQMAAGRAPALARAHRRGELPGGSPRFVNPQPGDDRAAYRFDEAGQRVVPVDPEPTSGAVLNRQEVGQLISFEMREAFEGIKAAVAGIQHDIQAQTRLMQFMDAPMEAITNSHERAAESFETLREDLAQTLSSSGLSELARVVDTAGLGEAQSRAEARFEALAARIETRLSGIEERQERTFTNLTADMLKILHLLERLQARELRDVQQKAAAQFAKDAGVR